MGLDDADDLRLAALETPLAGPLVDRWNRRWVMIISDVGAALSTLFVALLLLAGRLQVWHIYLSAIANSAFNSLQGPAYSASVTLLVPKQQYGRANGMVQLGEALGHLVSPLLAGLLVLMVLAIWVRKQMSGGAG